MIILDFGSGETCKNDINYIKRMIDELREVNSGVREVVIKWQLFAPETVPYCQPLSLLAFDEAYKYAQHCGIQTTASVFDTWSLRKLLDYDVPFVKIACRGWAYPLLGVPWRIGQEAPRAVVSVPDIKTGEMLQQQWNVDVLCCVPEYPASAASYSARFTTSEMFAGVSDHTEGLELFDIYEPDVYECHYRLDDSTGPDAAAFAKTPSDLGEIL